MRSAPLGCLAGPSPPNICTIPGIGVPPRFDMRCCFGLPGGVKSFETPVARFAVRGECTRQTRTINIERLLTSTEGAKPKGGTREEPTVSGGKRVVRAGRVRDRSRGQRATYQHPSLSLSRSMQSSSGRIQLSILKKPQSEITDQWQQRGQGSPFVLVLDCFAGLGAASAALPGGKTRAPPVCALYSATRAGRTL